MNTTILQGVHGCYCEDCSGNRIRVSTELATVPRRVLPRWARQRRLRVRHVSEVMLRREA
jgi:hypothetical protein